MSAGLMLSTEAGARYPYRCTECGRVGTRDDGISRIGDDCPDEECTGTIVSNRPSSSFRLWSDRIDGGTITRYQCVQWAHAIAPLPYGYSAGGKRTNLTADEACALVEKLDALPNGLALTADHEAAGREWMVKHGLRVGLPIAPRPELIGRRPFKGESVMVDHFAFVGAYDYLEGGGAYRGLFASIYRTWLVDGRVFDYAPTPWQSSAWGRGKLPMWWAEVRP